MPWLDGAKMHGDIVGRADPTYDESTLPLEGKDPIAGHYAFVLTPAGTYERSDARKCRLKLGTVDKGALTKWWTR